MPFCGPCTLEAQSSGTMRRTGVHRGLREVVHAPSLSMCDFRQGCLEPPPCRVSLWLKCCVR